MTINNQQEIALSYTNSEEHSVHYICEGSGRDIVVLPGLWTNSKWLQKYFDLRTHGKVWIIDPPYSNLTDCKTKHSIDFYASKVISAMKSLGIQKPVIMAESLGTTVALTIEKNMDVDKLVLIAPVTNVEKKLYFATLLQMLTPPSVLVRQRANMMFKRKPELIPEAIKMMSGFSKSKLLRPVMALKKYNALSFKPACPTLLIGGLYDKVSTPEKLAALARYFGAKLVINKKTGHHVTEYAWPDCLELITDFIES